MHTPSIWYKVEFLSAATVVRNGATESYWATWQWWAEVWRSSPFLQRCRLTWWTGPRCRIGILPQVCSGPGDICSPHCGCKDWGMSPRALDRVRMSEHCTWGTKPCWNALLKPWTVPDWRGSRACRSRCHSMISSSVNVLTINVDAPGHLGSVFAAHHTAN